MNIHYISTIYIHAMDEYTNYEPVKDSMQTTERQAMKNRDPARGSSSKSVNSQFIGNLGRISKLEAW